ncbi:MAG: dihydrofolate reductase family protein [Vagococcus sp.]
MTKRRVILYIATSVDGYIADIDGSIDWLTQLKPGEEPDHSYDTMYQSVDTVIMGRTTYDQVTTELAPNNYPYIDKHSYVLTSRKQDALQLPVTFTNQSVISLVTQLKAEVGKDIWIVGGHSVIQPLVEANLIDTYHIATIPVLLGNGIPLFASLKRPIFLKPIQTCLINSIIYQTFTSIKKLT